MDKTIWHSWDINPFRKSEIVVKTPSGIIQCEYMIEYEYIYSESTEWAYWSDYIKEHEALEQENKELRELCSEANSLIARQKTDREYKAQRIAQLEKALKGIHKICQDKSLDENLLTQTAKLKIIANTTGQALEKKEGQ